MATLPLNDCNETLLYRALVDVVQRQPDLLRVVQTWQVWSGARDDLQEITDKGVPAVRLSPSSDNSTVEALGLTTTPVPLQIDLVTDGTDVGDLMNLWDCVRRAFYPGDGSMQALLNQYGAYALVLTRPAYGTQVSSTGTRLLTARGVVTAQMMVSTGL